MTIYIDNEFKCYTTEGAGLRAVETEAFVGKCPVYIEGYRFIPAGDTWTREDGAVFAGEMVAPWKPYAQLDEAQRAYEKQLIADYGAALTTLGVIL